MKLKTEEGGFGPLFFIPTRRELMKALDKQKVIDLNNAINYALDKSEDGLSWLRAWREGDIEATKELNQYLALIGSTN